MAASITAAPSINDPLWIGALATDFTPAAACNTSSVYYATNVLEGGYHWLQQGPSYASDECFPSSAFLLNGFYQPGNECPSGYTPGCDPSTASGVATTICCPTLYNYSCNQRVAYNTFGCQTDMAEAESTITIDEVTVFGATSELLGPLVYTNQIIYAFSVQVRNTITESTSSTTSASLSSSTSTTTTASTSSSPAPEPSPGLAGGAIAGIVVGVVGALGVGALLVFLFMRRRGKGNANEVATSSELEAMNAAALGSPAPEKTFGPAELGVGEQPTELYGGDVGYRPEQAGKINHVDPGVQHELP